jgi:hypothetical protein
MGTFYFVPPPVTAAQIPVPLNLTSTGTSTVFGAATTGDTNNRVELDADGGIRFGSGAAATDTTISRVAVGTLRVVNAQLQISTGNLDVVTAGSGLKVAEGSNAKQGTFTLTGAATQAVPNTSITANSRVFLTAQVEGGTPGFIGVASRIPGTSFTVYCTATDTSTYAYEIFEPG